MKTKSFLETTFARVDSLLATGAYLVLANINAKLLVHVRALLRWHAIQSHFQFYVAAGSCKEGNLAKQTRGNSYHQPCMSDEVSPHPATSIAIPSYDLPRKFLFSGKQIGRIHRVYSTGRASRIRAMSCSWRREFARYMWCPIISRTGTSTAPSEQIFDSQSLFWLRFHSPSRTETLEMYSLADDNLVSHFKPTIASPGHPSPSPSHNGKPLKRILCLSTLQRNGIPTSCPLIATKD